MSIEPYLPYITVFFQTTVLSYTFGLGIWLLSFGLMAIVKAFKESIKT